MGAAVVAQPRRSWALVCCPRRVCKVVLRRGEDGIRCGAHLAVLDGDSIVRFGGLAFVSLGQRAPVCDGHPLRMPLHMLTGAIVSGCRVVVYNRKVPAAKRQGWDSARSFGISVRRQNTTPLASFSAFVHSTHWPLAPLVLVSRQPQYSLRFLHMTRCL